MAQRRSDHAAVSVALERDRREVGLEVVAWPTARRQQSGYSGLGALSLHCARGVEPFSGVRRGRTRVRASEDAELRQIEVFFTRDASSVQLRPWGYV